MPYSEPRETHPLTVERFGNNDERYKELKDPSVIRMPDGTYEMFASIGNSLDEIWKVGHFRADKLEGPWKELEPVHFITPPGLSHNLDVLNCCAPAVILEEQDGKPLYKMYLQTTCFQEDGVIAIATSQDGTHFTAQPETIATTDNAATVKPLRNVYDVGISQIDHEGEKQLYAVFTGCTKVGCGDLYYATRPASGTEKDWTASRILLDQKDVAFHNQPSVPHFEWGLEAGQVIQLDKDLFLLAAVCFLDKDGKEHNGTRQRIFFAASHTPHDFTPIGVAITPRRGENGHPDLLVEDGKLHMVYQEREGDKKPWTLSYTYFDLAQLKEQIKDHLDKQQSWAKRSTGTSIGGIAERSA